MAVQIQKKQVMERNKIEKKLRQRNWDISEEFSGLKDSVRESVSNILSGKIVSKRYGHIWYDEDTQANTLYYGKVEKLKKKGGETYVVGYWSEGETYEDSVEFDISKFALAADLIHDDVIMF